MTKQEWYKNYRESRILIKSLRNYSDMEEQIKPKIYGLMFDYLWSSKYTRHAIYDIKKEKCKWLIKHNSRAFDRIQHKRDRG
ncbi:hypothetical protein [uncultured Mediterranean phage uvMED]|nr:hypothetical protein [uncultured Mediterranean phage uvMED]